MILSAIAFIFKIIPLQRKLKSSYIPTWVETLILWASTVISIYRVHFAKREIHVLRTQIIVSWSSTNPTFTRTLPQKMDFYTEIILVLGAGTILKSMRNEGFNFCGIFHVKVCDIFSNFDSFSKISANLKVFFWYPDSINFDLANFRWSKGRLR